MSVAKPELLACCGLYCANCSGNKGTSKILGKCPGCREGGGPPQCDIRACATERGYRTCAECDELDGCSRLRTFVHRAARVLFRSDKTGNLQLIREVGEEAFLADRVSTGQK